jgi:WD40 repeat protein
MEEITTMKEIDAIRTRDQAYRPMRIKIRRPGGLDGFEGLFEVQRFNAHGGILRVASFNKRGNLLATAGADMVLKLWTVCGCSLDRNRWKKDRDSKQSQEQPAPGIIINEIPYKQYYGHKKDILDLSWSDHDFIITASMDKTVILWHHSKEGPLRVFQHGDSVSGVCFRQTENASLFLSCTINSRASLWDARRKRVLSFVEADSNVCTAIAVSPNGKYAVVGLDNGQLLFYEIPDATHEMDYFTTVECYTAAKKAKKVTGVIYSDIDPTYDHGARCVIVTTNDGKVRVFDTRNYEMVAKYCGTHNLKGYQIRAHFQNDYLICGSDQTSARIWRTNHRDGKKPKQSRFFKKRDYFRDEKHITWDPHPGRTVTTTHFAPARTCEYVQRWHSESLDEERSVDNVLITTDETGQLKVFINVTRDDPLF